MKKKFKIKILIPNTCWLHMIRIDVRNLIVGVILDMLSMGLCCRWASSFIQFLSWLHSEMTTKLDVTVFYGVSSPHKFWQIWGSTRARLHRDKTTCSCKSLFLLKVSRNWSQMWKQFQRPMFIQTPMRLCHRQTDQNYFCSLKSEMKTVIETLNWLYAFVENALDYD